jgi:hypothetical protein
LAPPYRPCDETAEQSPDQPLPATFGIPARSLVDFEPVVQHVFARFATIISGCGNWGQRRGMIDAEQIAAARDKVNGKDVVGAEVGSKRILSHAVLTPGQLGWP